MSAYREAGVDLAAAAEAVRRMRGAVEATHGPRVLGGFGGFGGMFDASFLKAWDRPILVSSTDGVGTKVLVAAALGRWHGIGQDLVHHAVNDILVHGAEPLFFLDQVASERLDPLIVAEIVGGIAEACLAHGCALLGGETSELPGLLQPGSVDVSGTIVGVVEAARRVDGTEIEQGDIVLALPSSGLHTNGYSLARRALAGLDWRAPRGDLGGVSVGDALLAPHRCYLDPVRAIRGAGVGLRGLVHVTGGGLVENPPRVLPAELAVQLDPRGWELPAIFQLIQRLGGVAEAEMWRVFNCGLGLLVIVRPGDGPAALAAAPDAMVVGEVVKRREQAVMFNGWFAPASL